ncbi:hypothetical protein [Mesorhizobium sp. WSM3873]|uniref:hypothetical protein n=1 Tax=Mesorhizobium sp. WSM3873 TaxID=1854056 RepID=UPI0012E9B1B3|nr:hypothetical protein [Mesorhizobium sp. WSM3873]
MTREQIKHIAKSVVNAFYEKYERRPNESEQAMIVDTIKRYAIDPKAAALKVQ